MFPTTFLRKANEMISYQAHCLWIKDKRFACIAKWKADATAAGEQTTYFHQRNQRCYPVSAGKLKVKRLMIISLVKHLRPGARMEATGIAM